MKRVGVFIDVSNLYYCIRRKYTDRKLDYKAYIDFCGSLGTIQKAMAYGADMGTGSAKKFIYCLEQLGFETKYKMPKSYNNTEGAISRKADWDVGITIDIVDMIDRIDILILGTADGDLEPLVRWAQRKGVTVIVLACGISRDLKDAATKFIEIPESMLEKKEEPTNEVVQTTDA